MTERGRRKDERICVVHEFEPVFDHRSNVLVLGSIPSPRSRREGFYYGHPRNRFWKVLSRVLEEPFPETIAEKKAMALRHCVALWDVLESCEIHGADDASIQRPVANDMSRILDAAPIRAVFTTGNKAAALYDRYCFPKTRIGAVNLPSTSPANCRMSEDALFSAYSVLLDYLDSGAGET